MADMIVYKQSELDEAIAAGAHHITLCAGIFNVPKTPGVCFDRIGPVKVFVQCSRREAADMKFEGIYPQYKPEYGVDTRASMAVVGAISSGSGIYGSGTYGSGSGYYGSFVGSGSIAASFRLSGSLVSGSYAVLPDSDIRIYGYGIDLI